MCTTEIAENVAEGTLKGAAIGTLIGGPAGGIIGAGIGTTKGTQKGIEKEFEAKQQPVKPPKDESLAEKQEKARALRRRLGLRPGRGREATIFSGTRTTGAGATNLKTKTGQ